MSQPNALPVWSILVIAEHDKAHLRGATLNTVAAAQKIGGDVHVLVVGQGAQAIADQAAKLAGVAKVLLADGPALADGLAENVAAQVRSEAHTSALQSLMRISYAVFCL